jgi:hypothetical protein
VQIIEVRGEAESLDAAFDVLVDVSSRVGDASTSSENIETTLGSDWFSKSANLNKSTRKDTLTEHFVADVVLPDEIAQKLLIHSGLIDDLKSED